MLGRMAVRMESSTGVCRMKCITGLRSSTSTASRPCTAAIGICRAHTPLDALAPAGSLDDRAHAYSLTSLLKELCLGITAVS